MGACGGGGGGQMGTLTSSDPAVHGSSGFGYRDPNYHPYETPSRITPTGLGIIHIGPDVGPSDKLQAMRTAQYTPDGPGMTLFVGTSRDGVGVDRLKNFREDLKTKDGTQLPNLSSEGLYPFRVKPRLLLGRGMDDWHSAVVSATFDTMFLLNDVLPPEYNFRYEGTYNNEIPPEGYFVFISLPANKLAGECGETAVACASNFALAYEDSSDNSFAKGYTRNAFVYLPDDFTKDDYSYAMTIIVHEAMHALGVIGHVDHIEFPDSLMGKSGALFPNLGFVIRDIDKEVLQIMYMSQETGIYNDWGEWTDNTLHLVAEADDGSFSFGTALFNGLPQPWGKGYGPSTALSENPLLSGLVTWHGGFLGFSGVSPLVGEVQFQVSLDALSSKQNLLFRDIAFLNKGDAPDRWFPVRDIVYQVSVHHNSFSHISREGIISGAFLGESHDHMAGTLKRPDMVGAFGGTR